MHATHDYLPPRVYDGEQIAALDQRFIEHFGATSQALMHEPLARPTPSWPKPGPCPGGCSLWPGPATTAPTPR